MYDHTDVISAKIEIYRPTCWNYLALPGPIFKIKQIISIKDGLMSIRNFAIPILSNAQ